MKKFFLALSAATMLLIAACGNGGSNESAPNDEPQSSGNNEQREAIMSRELEFMAFLHHFAEDEDFQMQHIKFPLGKLSYANIEDNEGWHPDDFTSRYWDLNNGNYMRVTEPGYFTWESNTKIVYDYNASLFEEAVADFGVEYTFEKIDGEWYVTNGDFYGSDVGMAEYVAGDAAHGCSEFRKKHTKPFIPYEFEGTPGDYPQASDRLLTEEDLQDMSKKELRLMRNEIMARHGYTFQSADLANHFNAFAWYSALFKNVDNSLSEIEHQNVDFIKAHEK